MVMLSVIVLNGEAPTKSANTMELIFTLFNLLKAYHFSLSSPIVPSRVLEAPKGITIYISTVPMTSIKNHNRLF
jgi:hypothetical protein